jgi:hypothetical protein
MSPDAGPIGSTVAGVGNLGCLGEATVRWDSKEAQPLTATSTDEDGVFRFQFAVPDDAANGPRDVWIRTRSASESNVECDVWHREQFTATPQRLPTDSATLHAIFDMDDLTGDSKPWLDVIPSKGTAGTPAVVVGNLLAEGYLDVIWEEPLTSGNGTSIADDPTSDTGAFWVPFDVPVDAAPGDHALWVIVRNPDDLSVTLDELLWFTVLDTAPSNGAGVARDDQATTDVEVPVDIDVLANDDLATVEDSVAIVIVRPPANGVCTEVGGNNTVRYIPDIGYVGEDDFVYSLVHRNRTEEGVSRYGTLGTALARVEVTGKISGSGASGPASVDPPKATTAATAAPSAAAPLSADNRGLAWWIPLMALLIVGTLLNVVWAYRQAKRRGEPHTNPSDHEEDGGRQQQQVRAINASADDVPDHFLTSATPADLPSQDRTKTPPWINNLGIEIDKEPAIETDEEPAIETDEEPAIEADGEQRPSLLKAIGSVLLGIAIWAWFGLLYFTGGDCALEGLEIECVSRSLITTINLPIAIVGLFFGLGAILSGLAGIFAAVSPKAAAEDPQL